MKKISNTTQSRPFSQIPDHWEPLIGYEYRKINQNGTPALDKKGKPKMGRIDLYDLMIVDAMRSFKERAGGKCFIESEQLAVKIGLRGTPLKKVCDRVLQLMHLGWIKATPEVYGATHAVRIVWEVNTKLLEDAAEGIANARHAAELLAVKNGDYSTLCRENTTLKEYIKEYLKEYSKEQITEKGEEKVTEKLSEQGKEKLTKYVKKHIPEESTDHGTEQVPEEVAEQSALTPVDADCNNADDIHISDFPVPESVQSDNDGQEATASPMGSDNNMPTVPADTQDTPTPEARADAAEEMKLTDIISEIDRVVKSLPYYGVPRWRIADTIRGITGTVPNYNLIKDEDTAWAVLAALEALSND